MLSVFACLDYFSGIGSGGLLFVVVILEVAFQLHVKCHAGTEVEPSQGVPDVFECCLELWSRSLYSHIGY